MVFAFGDALPTNFAFGEATIAPQRISTVAAAAAIRLSQDSDVSLDSRSFSTQLSQHLNIEFVNKLGFFARENAHSTKLCAVIDGNGNG